MDGKMPGQSSERTRSGAGAKELGTGDGGGGGASENFGSPSGSNQMPRRT